MEWFRIGCHSSQNGIIRLLLIGCLCLTLTLTQVLTPKDAKDILMKHNEYRKQESASNMYLMHWNVSLQERADAWAQQCTFKHERSDDVGENLFFDTDHENDVFIRGLEEWHKEKSRWGYTPNSCSGSCHFTQIVWGYTTTVGCSANVCPALRVANRVIKNAMLFICFYYPRGNFIGNFPYAKGRPCSECASGDTCVDNLCVSSGPISKLAPDYVKQLVPKRPISTSSSSRSFQEFRSLIQQFSSATSHEARGHHQQVHHRSEHHEHHQQHHFQSETVLSSASHSYTAQRSHSSQQQQQRHVYQSSQQYQQQHAPGLLQSPENNWLKERERQQAQEQEEEDRRQEIIQQQRQNRDEMEKRRQTILQEQRRQSDLEQQRQHLLIQKRQQEEDLYLNMLKKQEEERQQRITQEHDERMRQRDEDRRRKLEEEQRKHEEQQRSQQEHYKQSLLEAEELNRMLSSQPKRDGRTENIRVTAHQPTEKYRVTESPYDYSITNRFSHKEHQERATFSANLPINNQDRRPQAPVQNDNSRNDHSTLSRTDNQNRRKPVNEEIYSSRTHGSLTAQSSAVEEVVKLLSHGTSDNTIRSQQQYTRREDVLPPEWSSQTKQSGYSFQTGNSLTDIRTSVSENQPQEFTDNIYDDENNGEINRSAGTRESVNGLDSSGRKQPQENRTKHLKNKWRYRQSERKKLENSHRHKENYVMDTDGRRCVDRNDECTRWAIKCHKSSAVTLSCPMTCGKCGLHLSTDNDVQDDQTTENSPNRRNSPRGQKNERRNNPASPELSPAERKAKREQRRLERERNAPSALMARPRGEVTGKQATTERTAEQRQRKKGRRKEERQRHNQARQDLCRDDPKHVKSCKYWARKGFCLDNKLIGSLYCRHSCNSCQ